jgi:hypothetical protein
VKQGFLRSNQEYFLVEYDNPTIVRSAIITDWNSTSVQIGTPLNRCFSEEGGGVKSQRYISGFDKVYVALVLGGFPT